MATLERQKTDGEGDETSFSFLSLVCEQIGASFFFLEWVELKDLTALRAGGMFLLFHVDPKEVVIVRGCLSGAPDDP
jgi:hypothetical protein